MKKISIIFITILLLITNFSVIFADETEVDESDIFSVENENNSSNETNESDNKIDDLETNIKDINIKLNNVEKSISNLKSLTPGNYGVLTNFNKMSELQFEWYLENYNNYPLIDIYNTNNYLGYCNESDIYRIRDFGTLYYVDVYRLYILEPTGHTQTLDYTNTTNGYMTLYYYPNNESNDYLQGFYQLHFNDIDYYSLNPYSINVKNNGLNEYTISPESLYNLGYYPSGQSITITYDNSINDFFGYFDINGNLLSSNTSYTFDITENTNIVINYRAKEGIDYYPYMIYIIILLSFIVISNLFNGGKLYD